MRGGGDRGSSFITSPPHRIRVQIQGKLLTFFSISLDEKFDLLPCAV